MTVYSHSSPALSLGTNIVALSKIGEGMFGSVYQCVDEYQNKFACKTCEPKDHGIPNLMELSIMSSIIHPHLNRALCIRVDGDAVDIIQEIAVTDLSKHVASTPYISIHLKRQWIYQMISAIRVLHQCNIVHADIKANNVLLYSDNSVRLTDYTLSSIDHSSRNTRVVCNNMHRPIECLLKRPWGKPLDVWSLGCTVYHIVYGRSPFYHTRKEATSLRPTCVLNSILQWFTDSPWDQGSISDLNLESPCNSESADHCKFHLPSTFNLPENAEVNRLLGRMLQIIPSRRATIDELLQDKWFNGLTAQEHRIQSPAVQSLPTSQRTKYYRMVKSLCDDYKSEIRDDMFRLAISICERTHTLPIFTDGLRCHTAVWMSAKLLGVKQTVRTVRPHELFEAERVICRHLNYNLISPLMSNIT